MAKKSNREEFKIKSEDVIKKIKEIIKEGNARRVIINNEKGETLVEFPLTAGVVGIALAPILAAVGTLVALVSSCTIIVEKRS
jgi:hypothetical protein